MCETIGRWTAAESKESWRRLWVELQHSDMAVIDSKGAWKENNNMTQGLLEVRLKGYVELVAHDSGIEIWRL